MGKTDRRLGEKRLSGKRWLLILRVIFTLVEWFEPLVMMVSVPGCPGFESALIR